jgi:DNA-binding MarR family transcriptional regulator
VKTLIQNLNKAFDNRIRLGIMSAVVSNESIDFKQLKALLDITDGNLASHLKALEKEDYIQVQKQFIGRKPNTQYLATKEGLKAFKEHIDALESLIKEQINR